MFQVIEPFAQLARIADADGVAFPAFDGGCQTLAADRDFNDVLNVADANSVPCGGFAVDLVFEVRLADEPIGDDIHRAGHLLENLLHLQGDLFDLLQV